ncbi:Gfo/Idh/MocA family protein [Catalinimonas niigatensis]|uniref:Gfo/Idh/MocA family protein n=1 Tax=Catalinimonas niigatensis TaxID=1397264 RepID=UPI00266598F7|nr:Gfo/Idh/MocA family oxidoreductase [Catalinimonas niigatensis]WPP50759.1 Gfo/Idh/MocA family oxidoreductase [Catalinimonas niigatensis]
MKSGRRKFLQSAAQIATGISISAVPEHVFATNSPKKAIRPLFSANETIRVGLIGCNNMGWHNLNSMLKHEGVECIALCDVDSNVLDKRAAELEEKTSKKASLYRDYRKLLDNKDVDAVIIGTPDHWHCLQMIHACEAGKDVYVEKPIANSIEECNLMVAAAQRYQRVVQVGQWQRSDPHWEHALEYVPSGKLGKVRSVKSWAYTSYGRSFPVKANESVPAGVDYEMWLGPAPHRAFNPNRFHGSFRYFWDYAGGLMTDWGVHMIDMALAGMQVTTPLSVSATGGKYADPDSAAETPDTLQVLYDFGNFSMQWEQTLGSAVGPYNRNQPGVAFIGTQGTLVIDRSQWEILPEEEDGKFMTERLPVQKSQGSGLDLHTLNFLECIKSRQPTRCTIDMGRTAAVNAQLGNIAYRSGKKVFWDEKKNMVLHDAEIHKMTKAHYRTPWKLPKV